jgi:hypothetical protein
MSHLEEITKIDSRIPIAAARIETAQLGGGAQTPNATAIHGTVPQGINLTGLQVLAGSISLLCAMRFLLWAVFRLWLFQP